VNYLSITGFEVTDTSLQVSAVERRTPIKDLLNAAFRCWLENYGTEADKQRLPQEVALQGQKA
jgi:hypothetical protein